MAGKLQQGELEEPDHVTASHKRVMSTLMLVLCHFLHSQLKQVFPQRLRNQVHPPGHAQMAISQVVLDFRQVNNYNKSPHRPS